MDYIKIIDDYMLEFCDYIMRKYNIRNCNKWVLFSQHKIGKIIHNIKEEDNKLYLVDDDSNNIALLDRNLDIKEIL